MARRDWRQAGGNAFQQTLSGLEYDSAIPARDVDLFSRSAVEEYHSGGNDEYGYLIAQVLEPAVLEEVALLEKVPVIRLEQLEHRRTKTMVELAERVRRAGCLSVVELVRTASALISISRFDRTAALLERAAAAAVTAREAFEIAMLDFIVCNRRDDGKGSGAAFRRMRRAIEAGDVPIDRVMDACSQAVVWYVKRKEPLADDFVWFLATGREHANVPGEATSAALSTWYRGLAMIPAKHGEQVMTRHYMDLAAEAAHVTLERRPRAYERHLIKTYFESSLKEYMFVTRSLEKAEAAARALIDVDPAWAPSYGEFADALAYFGEHARAAELYEEAAALGPPYLGHHLRAAARCHQRAGAPARALQNYLDILSIAESRSIIESALALAREGDDPSRPLLEDAWRRVNAGSAVAEAGRFGS